MKYDTIGIGYDATRRPDPRIASRLAALLGTRPGGRYLDAACGTGNYTCSLARLGLDMTGIDQSAAMLAKARAKDPAIAWQQADVAALPFASGSFDGALCTQAIHHFPDLAAAFRELRRVLAGDARLVVFGGTRAQMQSYWLNAYFPRAMARAIAQQPSDAAIRAALDSAGLAVAATEPWSVPHDPVDLFLYAGKHRPGLYLDDRVRSGISTFAELAEPDEMARGLAGLERDIATGAIAEVTARYASGIGDYRFLVAVPA